MLSMYHKGNMSTLPLVIVNVTLPRPMLGRNWLDVLWRNWRHNRLNYSVHLMEGNFRYVTDNRQLRIDE